MNDLKKSIMDAIKKANIKLITCYEYELNASIDKKPTRTGFIVKFNSSNFETLVDKLIEARNYIIIDSSVSFISNRMVLFNMDDMWWNIPHNKMKIILKNAMQHFFPSHITF